MSDLTKLSLWMSGDCVHVVVETPRLARVKLAYEPELECFVMSRALMLGLSFPYDWGFLPSTVGEDGDPLDALVMHDAPTSPGLVLRCRIAGALLKLGHFLFALKHANWRRHYFLRHKYRAVVFKYAARHWVG